MQTFSGHGEGWDGHHDAYDENHRGASCDGSHGIVPSGASRAGG